MHYGYIIGQEAASLGYFEARLRTATNLEERRGLETVIQNIQRALEMARRETPSADQNPGRVSLCFQGGIGR